MITNIFPHEAPHPKDMSIYNIYPEENQAMSELFDEPGDIVAMVCPQNSDLRRDVHAFLQQQAEEDAQMLRQRAMTACAQAGGLSDGGGGAATRRSGAATVQGL